MEERRQFQRKSTSIKVEMTHPAFGTIVGFARDISDGGAQVIVDRVIPPPVGTIVKVRFTRMTGSINAEPVSMKVVHHESNILGLSFAKTAAL